MFSGDKSWGDKSLAETKVTFLYITSDVPMVTASSWEKEESMRVLAGTQT